MRYSILSTLLAILCTACVQGQSYEAVKAFPALYFQNPVEIVHAGDGSNRLFVLEQSGIIRVFPNNPNVAKADTFMNIKSKVLSGGELGLLGIAFHPDYKNNGYFYLDYTADNPRRTIIARYQVDPNNPNKGDAASEQVLLEINQPYTNHNGGKIAFGPDGYLYISMGDGGSGGDPENRAQNRSSLLGKMLRIDVNNTANGKNYALPADNPFVGNQNGYSEEIYAWGLRNAWKFSFDPETGWLWAADVGQGKWEEISLIEKGRNYGWRIMEGKHCYNPSTNCDTTGLVQPIWEYSHSLGVSVTGGYVYRGTALPGLNGKYIYGDFGSGRIWALEYDGESSPINTQILQDQPSVASFGVDQNNEIMFSSFNGSIYRIRQLGSSGDGSSDNDAFLLGAPKPNPASGRVVIPFTLGNTTSISIALFDAAGRKVQSIFDGTREAGHHEIAFEANSLPVGTYFCRMSSGAMSATQDLILFHR